MTDSSLPLVDKRSPTGRQKLIKAGLKLFGERGFHGTSVRDVAAEAGVSFGLIRKYFGTKEGLRDAVEDYVVVELQQFYEDFFRARSASPDAAVQRVMDFVGEDSRNILMYLRFALLNPGDGENRLIQRYVQIYTDVVNTLAEQNQLNESADRRWAALMLLFMQLGPMALEPFSETLFGQSIYSPEILRERQQAYLQMLTEPLLRS